MTQIWWNTQKRTIITKTFIDGWMEEKCPISIFTDNYLHTEMRSWTKTWSGVKEEEEHKDQENETEPKLSCL